MTTGKVALEGLEIHAFHGVYPHERESGNWFEVCIIVDTDFNEAARLDDLNGTVDYEVLFRIIKEQMEIPSKLIETVAEKIVERVLEKFGNVSKVDLKIAKINPPIGGKCKKAWVQLSRTR